MGLTSLLSDACHEMATAVLPGFLTAIGAPPSSLGFIEGVADSVSSMLKLWGGWVSDRLGRRKLLTAAGYLLTGISSSIFVAALSWHLVLAGRVVGWFGRGFRGPIRNAMLADSVDASVRGKAFGFHRAGDTVGAIAGPLAGVWLLSIWQDSGAADASSPFRSVFLVTLIPGILSAAVFAVMVVEKGRGARPGLEFWGTVRTLPPGFRRFLLGAGVFGLGDFAPSLLILAATRLLAPEYGMARAAQIAGLMYVLRNVSYALASYPIGALSDRIGRGPLLAGGYLLAAATVAGFAAAFAFGLASPAALAALFVCAGLFIAVEDTLEGAITADFIPAGSRGIGMGVLGTVNGVGDFAASTMVGVIWTAVSPVAGFGLAAAFMLAGAILVLRTSPVRPAP